MRRSLIIARGDFLGSGQQHIRGEFHRLQLADDLFRRESENVVVVISEGEEGGDRENEREHQSRDQGLDDHALARHSSPGDQAGEIGSQRPGGRGQHDQYRCCADHRAQQPYPVAAFLLHDVDHAAGCCVKHPAQHRRRDPDPDAPKIYLARPMLTKCERRESLPQPELCREGRARALRLRGCCSFAHKGPAASWGVQFKGSGARLRGVSVGIMVQKLTHDFEASKRRKLEKKFLRRPTS